MSTAIVRPHDARVLDLPITVAMPSGVEHRANGIKKYRYHDEPITVAMPSGVEHQVFEKRRTLGLTDHRRDALGR